MLLALLNQSRGSMAPTGMVCFIQTIRVEGKAPLVSPRPLVSAKKRGQDFVSSSHLGLLGRVNTLAEPAEASALLSGEG